MKCEAKEFQRGRLVSELKAWLISTMYKYHSMTLVLDFGYHNVLSIVFSWF